MGTPGAIPLSELVAFFSLHDIHSPSERQRWVEVIQLLDQVYLEYAAKKQEARISSHR